MNLVKIDHEIEDFRKRVCETLKLQKAETGMLSDQKRLGTWLHNQILELRIQKDEKKRSSSSFLSDFVGKMLRTEPNLEEKNFHDDITELIKQVKNEKISSDYKFTSEKIPAEIIETVNRMKGLKWTKYYGYARGPFLENMFILKKQYFHSVIKEVSVNNLKFLMIQEKVAHSYQRNLVQQIFGRVFRSKGSLSMVIKIEVNDDPLESTYNLFCYIEDEIFKEKTIWQPLSSLVKDYNRLFVQVNSERLEVSQVNMLEIIFSQFLILPLQSLVSNFIVCIKDHEVEIVKCSEQGHDTIIEEQSLKDHPSLRNPLLYFKQYIRENQVKITTAEKITDNKDLFSCFYKCMAITIDLLLTDFATMKDEVRINKSICFNEEVFIVLWNTFHKIIVLQSWMKEVIEPVKDSITMAEIIAYFCPIFNEIGVMEFDSYKAYSDFYQNLDMGSFLANFITKKSIEKYKQMYVNEELAIKTQKMKTYQEVYKIIFRSVLEGLNMDYIDPVEACYIMNFICKYKYDYAPFLHPGSLVSKWKNKSLWQKCVQVMTEGRLLYIDIGFDYMAYSCGFDTVEASKTSFERISETKQTDVILAATVRFVDFVKIFFENNSIYILSSLLEKSFKYNKFKICRILLDKMVRIRDFKEIIEFQEFAVLNNEITKEQLLNTIKLDSPQMHRLFSWQQIMYEKLKKPNGKEFETIEYGKLYLPEEILNKHINKTDGLVINNISRKDYRFNVNREMALVEVDASIQFYIERQQYPLISYFYKILLTKLEIPELMLNFTSFFYKDQMYSITERMPHATNYEKGLKTFTENQLNLMADDRLISESIIVSMLVLPESIQFKDLIICQSHALHDQIFVVDWHQFYHKSFMNKYAGKTNLNCKNSLFLLDIMNKNIHPAVIKKYADISALNTAEKIFNEIKVITEKIAEFQARHCNQDVPHHQLLATIFEEGFIFNFTERLNKIKRAFKKKGSYEKGISYFELLNILDSETSYYYEEIVYSSNKLIQRQVNLANENWTRPFVNGNTMIEFFGSFTRLEEVDYSFPEHYYKFCFQGPTEGMFSTIKHVKKFPAFELQLPYDLEEYSNENFEYFMKNCDLVELSPQQQQKFLQITKIKSRAYLDNETGTRVLPLSYIKLSHIEVLKQKYIHTLSYERVEQLVIQSCKLGEYEINTFPKTIQNILYLTLKNIEGLKYIGENVFFGKPIEIKHLKVLTMIQCNELISIDIRCEILQSLELRNNKSLQNIYIYSRNLKNIYIFNNPKINLENVGIYILKGVNVLMCKASCNGDIMKLYSENYDDYVTKIMKFLLIKFYQPQSRYLISLTLSKMKEVDDSLFTIAGISSFKPISSMFYKYTGEIEDKLLASLFRIFFSNPYIQTLSTQNFGEANLNSPNALTLDRVFKLMALGIEKHANVRPIRQIKIVRANRVFEGANFKHIKKFIDKVKGDKYFTLIIEDLELSLPVEKKQSSGEYSDKFLKKYADNSVEQLSIEIIRYLAIQKEEILNMNLVIRNSRIQIDWLARIFERMKPPPEVQEIQKSKFKKKQSCLPDELRRLSNEKQGKSHEVEIITKLSLENTIITNTQEINFQNCNLSFDSVKSLKILNSTISSYSILKIFYHLRSISISNLKLLSSNGDLFSNYQLKILNILEEKLELTSIDIGKFFNNSQNSAAFQKFCNLIEMNSRLKNLKISDNEFTIENLLELGKCIGNSKIEQLTIERIEITNRKSDKELFKNFLAKSQCLKSLTIQIENQEDIKEFVKAIAENKSLVELKIYTDFEISSEVLRPLSENSTLNYIYSNIQLPIWLLNQVKTNSKLSQQPSLFLNQGSRSTNMEILNTSMSNSKNNDYYRMGLSLDGGGIRGMLLATELNYLCEKVGYPIHKIFDVVGGTSIGGILTLASTCSLDGFNPVCSSRELMEIFEHHGGEIFKKTQGQHFRNLFNTKYSIQSYENVLKIYYKDCRLSNCLEDTNAIVTAVNRVDNKDYIFRSTEALLNPDKDFYLRDVARATSAAPTYFPSAEIKNINATMKLSLIDGGVGLNNPSKLVIDEVKKISTNLGSPNNYFLLSLGTGRLPSQTIPQFAGIKDLSPIIDSFTESANYFVERDLSNNYKGHFFRVSPTINITNKKEGELDNTTPQIINIYKQTGLESGRKYFHNTVIFGKYRDMNLIEWLQENTAKKYDI